MHAYIKHTSLNAWFNEFLHIGDTQVIPMQIKIWNASHTPEGCPEFQAESNTPTSLDSEMTAILTYMLVLLFLNFI